MQYEEAINDFSIALSFNPEDAEAFHNRGSARLALEDLNGASIDFE